MTAVGALASCALATRRQPVACVPMAVLQTAFAPSPTLPTNTTHQWLLHTCLHLEIRNNAYNIFISTPRCQIIPYPQRLLIIASKHPLCALPFADSWSWNPHCSAIAAFVRDCAAANDCDHATRNQDQQNKYPQCLSSTGLFIYYTCIL